MNPPPPLLQTNSSMALVLENQQYPPSPLPNIRVTSWLMREYHGSSCSCRIQCRADVPMASPSNASQGTITNTARHADSICYPVYICIECQRPHRHVTYCTPHKEDPVLTFPYKPNHLLQDIHPPRPLQLPRVSRPLATHPTQCVTSLSLLLRATFKHFLASYTQASICNSFVLRRNIYPNPSSLK